MEVVLILAPIGVVEKRRLQQSLRIGILKYIAVNGAGSSYMGPKQSVNLLVSELIELITSYFWLIFIYTHTYIYVYI